DAYQREGSWGVLGAWLPMLLDLAITAVEEHRKKGFRMSKSTLIRWSGPILMVGGGLFMIAGFGLLEPGPCSGCDGIYQVRLMMLVPSLLLLAIGLAGVYAWIAPRINRLGRLGLILAIAAAPLFAIIFLLAIAGIVAWDVMERVAFTVFLLPYFG